MYVYIDNDIQLEDKPAIIPNCMGLLHGYGLFETIKIYNKNMCFFDQHIERLKSSCPQIGISFNSDVLNLFEKCISLIHMNKIINGSIRISLIKDNKDNIILIQTRDTVYKQEAYDKGFALCISDFVKNPLSPLCRIKSMNYLENILAKNSAVEKGFNEAIFVNTHNFLTEGAVSNLFWVTNGHIYTPSIECGLLSGITRNLVIAIASELGIQCTEGTFQLEDLYDSDEIFITNSLMGVMPVSRLENQVRSINKNSVTSIISAHYNKLEALNAIHLIAPVHDKI